MTICDRFLQNKIHSDTIAYLFTMTLIRTYENHKRLSPPRSNITLYLFVRALCIVGEICSPSCLAKTMLYCVPQHHTQVLINNLYIFYDFMASRTKC